MSELVIKVAINNGDLVNNESVNDYKAITLFDALRNTDVIKRYNEQGFHLGAYPCSKVYNPFQDNLYNYVCCLYPELCNDALNEVCSPYNSYQVSLDPSIAQWCGCHLQQVRLAYGLHGLKSLPVRFEQIWRFLLQSLETVVRMPQRPNKTLCQTGCQT